MPWPWPTSPGSLGGREDCHGRYTADHSPQGSHDSIASLPTLYNGRPGLGHSVVLNASIKGTRGSFRFVRFSLSQQRSVLCLQHTQRMQQRWQSFWSICSRPASAGLVLPSPPKESSLDSSHVGSHPTCFKLEFSLGRRLSELTHSPPSFNNSRLLSSNSSP